MKEVFCHPVVAQDVRQTSLDGSRNIRVYNPPRLPLPSETTEKGDPLQNEDGRIGLLLEPHMGGHRPWILFSYVPGRSKETDLLSMHLEKGGDAALKEHLHDLGPTPIRAYFKAKSLKYFSISLRKEHIEAIQRVVGPAKTSGEWLFRLLLQRRKSGALRIWKEPDEFQLWMRL